MKKTGFEHIQQKLSLNKIVGLASDQLSLGVSVQQEGEGSNKYCLISDQMKNSNSRDKYAKTQAPPADNRLMKTANQTRPVEQDKNNRPSSGKQIPPKNAPTRGPIQKKEYIVEDNMTESRICEAKQGLQLLKKKMSAKGMSREKIKAPEEKPKLKAATSYKDIEEDYSENTNQNSLPPRNIPKRASEKTPTVSSKQIQQRGPKKAESQPSNKVESQPSNYFEPRQQQYNDPEMEAPIKPKKDFYALLEEEMRKENKGSKPSQPAYRAPSQYPADEGELIKCSQGCERMFNSAAIQKHERVCQKVFLTKRKAFDSASHRAPEVEGFNKPPEVPSRKQIPAKQSKQPAKEEKGGKIPKWKQQSLAFRAGLKQGKGTELTQEEKQATENANGDMIQCKFCGRKFNETAGKRHIAFCETKSKQTAMKKR